MSCIICGESGNSKIECEECGNSICFSCSRDQISSRYICCCCHKYEFKPSRVFNQLEHLDFEVWFSGFVKRKLENAIEIKTKLHQIIHGFLKEVYYKLPVISGLYPLHSILKNPKIFSGDIRSNLFIQTNENITGLDEIYFKRFLDELERFINDNSYILYMPREPIKIKMDNPTIQKFIKIGDQYLSRYNPTLISKALYVFEKNNRNFDDISAKMYKILRASPFKVLNIPREGKAEGICENCNNGILYLVENEKLRCSICGAKYCYGCLSYVSDEIENHICDEKRVEEVRNIRAISSICPFCGRRIQKVENTCNDIFCVFCHRGFNYVTREELNYEFENEERKKWLNENGQDYDTSLSSQFRKMPIYTLAESILGLLIFRGSSITPIIDFLGKLKILEYATRIENSSLMKKDGISSKIYRVEAEIFKDEFIDFVYTYFEEFTKMIEEENSFNNILVMNASIDLILRKLDFLHVLSNRMNTLYPDLAPVKEFYSILSRITMFLNSNLKKWINNYVVDSPHRSMFSLNVTDYKSLYSDTVESIIEKSNLSSLIDRFPNFYKSLIEVDGYTPKIRINMRGRYKAINEDLVVDGVKITEEIIRSSSFRVEKDDKKIGPFKINYQ